MISILHVDDSQADRVLVGYQLRRLGADIQIDECASASEALEVLAGKNYDCVVSDYQMPGMDGLEFLKRFKDLDDETPFIFLTGQGNEDIAVNAFRNGADDYFTKEAGFAHINRLFNSINLYVEAKKLKEKSTEIENRLRSEIEKSQLYLDITGDIIVAVGADDSISMVNERGSQILGYPRDTLIGMDWFDHFLPETDRAKVREVHAKILNGDLKPVEYFDNIIVTRDGTERLISWHNALVRDAHGNIIGTLSAGRDITDIQEIDERLTSVKNKYRLLADNAEDGIVVFSDKKVVFFNNAAKRILELDEANMFQLNLFDLVESDYRQEILERYDKRISGRDVPEESRFPLVTGKGKQIWVEYRAVSVVWNGRPSILTFFHDISYLHEIERDYRMLFESMYEGFALHEMIFDDGRPADYRFLAVNPAFEKLTGLRAADILGRTVREILPETEQSWIDAYGAVVTTGEPARFENYAAALDRYWEVTAFRPQPGRFACVFRDVTAIKKAELKLQNQRDDLVKVNANLEAFAFSASHDLKSPLRRIDGFIRILEKSLDDRLTDDERDYFGFIKDSSSKMQRLVEGLLGLSVSDTKKIVRTGVDLSNMTKDIIGNITRETPDITVKFIVEKDLYVEADSQLLATVITNLIDNAIKYSSDVEEPVVRIGATDTDKGQAVFVRDNGIGFDPNAHDLMFSMFSRLNKDTDVEGSGIGLATVKKIVERHGGTIWAENNKDGGSTFYFTIN